MDNECKVVEVEEIETPYKIRCTILEPMRYKDYDRKKKKIEDKKLIKEREEER